MAEEEEGGGTGLVTTGASVRNAVQGSGDVRGRSDPENGQMSGLDLLRLAADRTLAEHFEDIAKCILNNAKEKWNIHAVKMLVDLAEQVKARGTAPAEAYQSLAEVLWKAYQEQGLGNRD